MTEINEARLQRARRVVRAVLAFIVLLLLLAAAVVTILLLPFNPFILYSYTPQASVVCQGKAIDAHIEYELVEGVEVNHIEAESTWTAVDVPEIDEGQEIGGLEGTLAIAPPNEKINTVLPRVAPPHKGEWRLKSDITVRGTAYGLPHVEVVEAAAEETTTVLPTSDPGCNGGEV